MQLQFCLCLVLLVFSCARPKNHSPEEKQVFYYDVYDRDNNLLEKNAFRQEMLKISNNEYKYSISAQDSLIATGFLKTDSTGIYHLCNQQYRLSYAFDSLATKYACGPVPPFIHSKIYRNKKKQYYIAGKPYQVYCYIQVSDSHSGNITYYLKGFGFICFYEDESNTYLLCQRGEGWEITTKELGQLNQLLINDGSFFRKYIVPPPPELYQMKFLPPDKQDSL